MSAAAQMEKMPLAKLRSLKPLSKTSFDKVLCEHKGESWLNVSKICNAEHREGGGLQPGSFRPAHCS